VVGKWLLIVFAFAVGGVGVLLWSAAGRPSSRGGVERSVVPTASDRARVDRIVQRYVTPSGSERVHRYVSPSGSDRAAGTRARPWRTIGHAARRVRPGYLVHVAPGRYPRPLTISRGGTEARRVRFVSDRRWRARIAAGGTGAITAVEIQADHVTFQGFEVRASGGDGTAGISVEGSHDAVIGNRVRRVAAPCVGDGASGIVIGGGRNDYRNHGGYVDRNLVERIGTGARDGTCRLVHGIYAAVPGVAVSNNIVSRALGDGITSWHAARTLTIANNLSAMNGGAGILVGSGDSGATEAGHTGTLVANNIVYRNARDGVTESSDGSHPVGPGNRYLNNLTFGNAWHDGGEDPGADALPDDAMVAGTLSADPGFLRGGPVNSYVLRKASPAVDAGTRAGAPRHDFDGSRRPRGRGIDIGPHELAVRAQP
jgi:Right handed beta helix region